MTEYFLPKTTPKKPRGPSGFFIPKPQAPPNPATSVQAVETAPFSVMAADAALFTVSALAAPAYTVEASDSAL